MHFFALSTWAALLIIVTSVSGISIIQNPPGDVLVNTNITLTFQTDPSDPSPLTFYIAEYLNGALTRVIQPQAFMPADNFTDIMANLGPHYFTLFDPANITSLSSNNVSITTIATGPTFNVVAQLEGAMTNSSSSTSPDSTPASSPIPADTTESSLLFSLSEIQHQVQTDFLPSQSQSTSSGVDTLATSLSTFADAVPTAMPTSIPSEIASYPITNASYPSPNAYLSPTPLSSPSTTPVAPSTLLSEPSLRPAIIAAIIIGCIGFVALIAWFILWIRYRTSLHKIDRYDLIHTHIPPPVSCKPTRILPIFPFETTEIDFLGADLRSTFITPPPRYPYELGESQPKMM